MLKANSHNDDEPVFLVGVRCMTYNHERYIIDALDGFVMQQTHFPYVCAIIDDASTDRNAEVIRAYLYENFDFKEEGVAYEKDMEYGTVAFARHKTNENCFFAVVFLKENHYSQRKPKFPYLQEWLNVKYLALCEGDDYWTDSTKLQKQVDFLEADTSYSMCFHKVNIASQQESDQHLFSYLKEGDYSAKKVYRRWVVPTCTVLYRRDEERPFERNPAVVFGDIFMWLQLAERGKLRCMGFTGATYRRHQGSVSCGYSVETSIKLYYQYKFFEKRFPKLKDISRRKQEEEGLADIIKAPYFPGSWKYRFLYMMRHRRLFFSSFFVETVFLYTPIRNLLFWKKK